MKDELRTLSDADISSRRIVSRRALLHTLGIGAGVAAAAAAGATSRRARAQTKPGDPCRDGDHGPSDTDGCGRPPIS